MNATPDDAATRIRRAAYLLLIALAAANAIGRTLAVNTVDRIRLEKHLQNTGRDDWQRQMPFLSANDRSRWCTVRALVEHGTYAIDDVVADHNWHTIDMVKHDDSEGVAHLYSSKPTLFPTLLAAEYWVIHRLTGATFTSHPYAIGRFMLLTVNVLPLIVYFLLLARLVERYGTTDFGRLFVMACATGGTFVTTFAVVLNNHLIAAASAAVAIDAGIRIWYEGERRWRFFVLAGLSAAFTAANELPALAFFVALSAALAWKAPRESLIAYAPAAAVVVAAFFGTNYAAHNTLLPAYAYNSKTDPQQNWYDYTYEHNGRTRDSYWKNPTGVDRGEADPGRYALHVLIGHHGIFSLTPIWILSLAGLAMAFWNRNSPLRGLALFIAVISITCLVFYLSRPLGHRNYGGVTSGFRWMFWFAPLWLVAMLPSADWLSHRRWRVGLGLVLLAFSAISASLPTWNPWTHPWIYRYFEYLQWLR